jgi:beta-phosphoglucomutase-like phosphatase (HAD superfamily)
MPIREIVERLALEQGIHIPAVQVAKRKEELYFDHLPNLKPVPQVLEHIEQQHRRIPFATVTGCTKNSVETFLRALNLLEKFDILVCAGD